MQRFAAFPIGWFAGLLLIMFVSACGPAEQRDAPGEIATAPPPQNELAQLTGDVVDYHGRPLAGAMVTARDDRRAINVSVFTDGNGRYGFPELETGSWRMRVRHIGSEIRSRTVQLGSTGLDVDFQLRLAEDPYELLPASYW